MKNTEINAKLISFILSLSLYITAQPLLTDTSATYTYKNENFKLGFYEGTNQMPAEHLADGLEIAREMRKMSKINIVPIGHSVPTNIFNGWNWNNAKSQYKLAANTNFSSACAGAVMAWDWLSRIKNGGALAGIQASDVHVLVVQLTWAPFFGPDNYEKNTPLSQKIDSMSHDFRRLAQNAKKNYPNLKMILFEADPWQNDHEPYHAYHEWLFAREVMLDQIKGDPELAYKGSSAKTVWIGLGGYFWYPNAPRSYYTDCCHISGSGATHYQEKWVKNLLEMNPVVSYWLSETEPVVEIKKNLTPTALTAELQGVLRQNRVDVTISLLNSSNVSIGLFTIDGRAVIPMSAKLCQSGSNSITLNTNEILTPGTYILQMNYGKETHAINLITVSD